MKALALAMILAGCAAPLAPAPVVDGETTRAWLAEVDAAAAKALADMKAKLEASRERLRLATVEAEAFDPGDLDLWCCECLLPVGPGAALAIGPELLELRCAGHE